MRQAWFLALCRRQPLGVILAGALAFAGIGCHQHYHYYNSSACGPSTTLPSTVQSGTTICEDGTQVVEGGTKVSNGPTISSSVGSNSNSSGSGSGSATRSSRVVVSQPLNSGPRYPWKSTSDPDPDSSVARVEGALDGPTVKQ